MTVDTPQQVTRFYGTVNYAMDVIKNKQIAFVHASMLNDPFDPYCFFETDFEDSYKNLVAHVRKNHPCDLPWFRFQSWDKPSKTLRRICKW